MNNNSITILGAGVMGSGVAELFATHCYQVEIIDKSKIQLQKSKDRIMSNLKYNFLTQGEFKKVDSNKIIGNIKFTDKLENVKKSNWIIENITEKWSEKEKLYSYLNNECSENCIIGVNTSAISITKISSLMNNPSRIVGMHFMNPVPRMPLIEVVKGYHTNEHTLQSVRELLQSLNKKMVTVEDSAGFVTNRAMMIFINEAIFMLQEKISSVEDIDILFRQCFGHKMGPLQTADLIGLDTILYSLEVIYNELNDSKYRPCWLLKKMVNAGLLGEKSKKGFYTYE
ncbi:3-hydroxyacyl-CoA dehydrogenase family protein [Marinomonas sp. TI.3.20]|uniref:3-hydroxyacyl-CoA dehydrogenase family protein n=1 Tax=Marinomonas sp. TI.3.20 TaxID=3121296 RepID=UPI00311E4AA2